MERIRITSRDEERHAIAAAAAVLRRGGIVAYPTDTLYGLAADPANDEAIERLFDVKGRDRDQAIPLIAADLDQACAAGEFNAGDRLLAAAFWPGPLAIVVFARPIMSRALIAANGTIAVRVPAHPLARDLAAAVGTCITATSANASGQPGSASADVVAAGIGARLDLLLDAGDAPGGPPSTIVALRDDGPVLVRAGAIAWERVLESLGRRP